MATPKTSSSFFNAAMQKLMKLVVGLGNPGRKYEGTRHNIGFEVIEFLAKQLGGGRSQAKFDSDFLDVTSRGERILLVRPLTYMNLSGHSVRRFVDFFRIPLSDILVICDDLSLPVGTVRMRPGGSSAGQKGLKHICDQMGSTDVPRLRIGIGAAPADWETSDFVLSRISGDDRAVLDQAVSRSGQAVLSWIELGIMQAMNSFNGAISGGDDDKQSGREK